MDRSESVEEHSGEVLPGRQDGFLANRKSRSAKPFVKRGDQSCAVEAAVLTLKIPSLRFVQSAILAGLLFLPLLWALIMSNACAGDHGDHYWVSQDPTIGYAVSIQRVYQFSAAFVDQPGA